jgi:magnesium transporter
MFRVLEVGPNGDVTVTEGEASVARPPEGVFRWIDIVRQDSQQLDVLAERFRFHPLTLEDCANFGQRPKLEEYGDYLFLVTHGFRLVPEQTGVLETHELHTFLGERYLVTVHELPIGPLDQVWNRVASEGNLARRGADFVSYLISDAVVDTFFPLVDDIAAEVEEIEEVVLERPNEADLGQIMQLKRLLVTLRKVLSPQRDTFAMLAKRGGNIPERTSIYYRDVYDHLLRVHESVEATRDLLGNVLDAYLWSASQRTNEIMKRLTILSAIFLPLTFITGFFGQNFDGLPFDSKRLLAAMLASCALVPAGMLYFFLRSKWF